VSGVCTCRGPVLNGPADGGRKSTWKRAGTWLGTAYRRGVRGGRERPTVLQWLRYAYGGRLPRDLSGWVLRDTTARTWIWRHLARAAVQLLPVVVLCIAVVPAPLGYRISAAVGGSVLALVFSMAYVVETTEHRVVKAGFASGTAAQLREERAERARVERRSPYRRDGAGSFD
jgi:hypothetical protein